MNVSKQHILERLRQQRLEDVSLPDLADDWIRYDDPGRQFAEVLQSVGGRCVEAESAAEADHWLQQLPEYRQAQRVCSLVPAIGRNDVDLNAIARPHDLADVDFVIAPGDLAVAENGAVWFHDGDAPRRAVVFLTRHLAFVVPRQRLVHNMHEAYAQLTWPATGFGAFVSGPSKTADIEQSLVIGAHGAKSLTVILVAAQ